MIRTHLNSFFLFFGFIFSFFTVVWIADPFARAGEEDEGRRSRILREFAGLIREMVGREEGSEVSVVFNEPEPAVFKLEHLEETQEQSRAYDFQQLELAPIVTLFQAEQAQNNNNNNNLIDLDTLKTVPFRPEFPVGIQNPHNFCYANVVLQALFRMADFRKIVGNLGVIFDGWVGQLKIETSKNTEIIEGIRIAEGLNHLFSQLQSNQVNEPAQFHKDKTSQCIPGHFSLQNQEDADDYLNKIIGSLREILPSDQQNKISINLINFGTHKGISSNCIRVENRPSFIEPFCRFSLPIIGPKPKTLVNLIQNYLADEVSELKFDNDGEPGILTRIKRIDYLPQVVPIQLQRLYMGHRENTLKKIVEPVEIPLELDFAPFFHSEALESFGSSATYQLKMFIEHRGCALDGHYVIYTREPDDTWILLNDSVVRRFEGGDNIKALINSGYMYFYERLKK